MKYYFIYIMTNHSRTLYNGVTNNLERRIFEHKSDRASSFTSRYKINKLFYFEDATDIYDAIEREKEIKGWLRSKKIKLIESINPDWKDLAQDLDSSLRSE